MRVRKPSPAMVVALTALVFSMTGTGIAAKTMITGKQIKDHSITSKDLAKGAVKSRQIGKGAVTSRTVARDAIGTDAIAPYAIVVGDIAPNAVTSENIVNGTIYSPDLREGDAVEISQVYFQPQREYSQVRGALTTLMTQPITQQMEQTSVECPDGTRAAIATWCPTTPYARVSAQNVTMNQTAGSCFFRQDVPFTTLNGRTAFAMWDNSTSAKSELLTATKTGFWTVTANLSWVANSAGTARSLSIRKTFGPASGANAGQHGRIYDVNTPPHPTETTELPVTVRVPLEAGDSVSVEAASCGANVAVANATLGFEYAGA